MIIWSGDTQPSSFGESSSHTNITSRMNELTSKCRSLMADAQVSAEILEAALQEEYIGGIQNELNDLEKYEIEYNEAYVEIIAKYSELINRQEIDDAKRRFFIFVKRYKAKAIEALRPSASGNLSTHSNKLKFQKIEIRQFCGRKEDWIPFKRFFETYVHNDRGLT